MDRAEFPNVTSSRCWVNLASTNGTGEVVTVRGKLVVSVFGVDFFFLVASLKGYPPGN